MILKNYFLELFLENKLPRRIDSYSCYLIPLI